MTGEFSAKYNVAASFQWQKLSPIPILWFVFNFLTDWLTAWLPPLLLLLLLLLCTYLCILLLRCIFTCNVWIRCIQGDSILATFHDLIFPAVGSNASTYYRHYRLAFLLVFIFSFIDCSSCWIRHICMSAWLHGRILIDSKQYCGITLCALCAVTLAPKWYNVAHFVCSIYVVVSAAHRYRRYGKYKKYLSPNLILVQPSSSLFSVCETGRKRRR